MTGLVLRSDVSNDLKQSADQIGSVAKALTEFVWNSVQYQPEGQAAEVAIIITRNRTGGIDEAYVIDNGRGMDQKDLQRFFTMHAENQDRLLGRMGRGRFGTGAKAAAMAVADELVVNTVKDGQRTIATLRRDVLIAGSTEIPIPAVTEEVQRANGTRVILSRFRLKKRFNEEAAKAYVQRALGRVLLVHRVTWNGEVLSYSEPSHRMEWLPEPPDEFIGQIGNVRLQIRLSEQWLPENDRGIRISANDVTLECGFLGNHAASPHAGHIFGSVDVPLLEQEDEEGRPAYTADRSMVLNRENLRVNALLTWINDAVGDVIKELEMEERAQQDRERQERLLRTAHTIEQALNRRLTRAFENMEHRISLKGSGNSSLTGVEVQSSETSIESEASEKGEGEHEYVREDTSSVRWRQAVQGEKPEMTVMEHSAHSEHGDGERGGEDKEANAVKDPEGDRGARLRESAQGKQRRLKPRGSFRVIPKAMGSDAPRAYYAASHMTIYVNTDHPQVAAAGSEASVGFKILLAECAASEFALALTAMRIENGDPEVDQNQWQTIIIAIRREESETGAELAEVIATYGANN